MHKLSSSCGIFFASFKALLLFKFLMKLPVTRTTHLCFTQPQFDLLERFLDEVSFHSLDRARVWSAITVSAAKIEVWEIS